MTLPASQYSVLDAKRIERIDDDTFRCYVGGISFLNFKVRTLSMLSHRLGEFYIAPCPGQRRPVVTRGS